MWVCTHPYFLHKSRRIYLSLRCVCALTHTFYTRAGEYTSLYGVGVHTPILSTHEPANIPLFTVWGCTHPYFLHKSRRIYLSLWCGCAHTHAVQNGMALTLALQKYGCTHTHVVENVRDLVKNGFFESMSCTGPHCAENIIFRVCCLLISLLKLNINKSFFGGEVRLMSSLKRH